MLLRRNLILKQSIRRRLSTSAPPPPPPPPPPPAPPKGGNNGLFLFLAIAGAGGAYYYQNELKELLGGKPSTPSTQKPAASSSTPATKSSPVASSAVVPDVVPSKEELTKLEKVLVTDANKKPKPLNWDDVRARVVDLMDDSEWDDGSWGPVFVRLAWHAAGTYDTKTKKGGSDGGLMRFKNESEWGANAGLAHARARLEPLKREFPDASFADLWSFAGTVAIEEMGGPKMKWRPGRKDVPQPPKENLPDGLLPDADGRDKKENPADHLRDIFGRQGFNDREIVALSGAHAMGRCHTDRSGYWGPWTRAPTTFSNDYFRLLLEEKWTPKKLHQGKNWTGPAQYEDKTGELMMLPTDLALVQDAKMRPIVEEYAKDEKKFFDDFAKAWIKLQENGVKSLTGTRRYYFFGPRE